MASRSWSLLFIIVGLAGALSLRAESPAQRIITETPITFPHGTKMETVTVSPDGKHLAFVQVIDGQDCVNIDGLTGKGYASLRAPIEITQPGKSAICSGIFFSPDSKHYAYMARQDAHWSMVIDGQDGAAYDELDIPIFSPNGAHIAYKARKGEQWCVVVDGKEGKLYQAIGADEGFPGVRTDGAYLIFSADGAHCSYIACITAESIEENGVYCVVQDGVEGAAYDHIADLIYTPDGKHLAYVAEKNREMFAVRDGQQEASYARVDCPAFAPDGAKLAYIASTGRQQYFVVVNGQQGKAYEGVQAVSFSPDGKHYYFVAQSDDRQCMVSDGREEPQYTRVSAPIFSADGKHVAHVAVEGTQWYVVKDGAPGPAFNAVGPPIFAPDGAHIAYAARKGPQTTAVLDGETGAGVNGMITGVQFTPDGKHLLYEAHDTSGVLLPVTIALDNHPGHRYDRLFPLADDAQHLFFDSANHFHYFAEKDQVIYRVDERIE